MKVEVEDEVIAFQLEALLTPSITMYRVLPVVGFPNAVLIAALGKFAGSKTAIAGSFLISSSKVGLCLTEYLFGDD